MKKNGLFSKGLKLLYLNYEVAGVTEAAARGLDDRIRGPTLVFMFNKVASSKVLTVPILYAFCFQSIIT